jgi:hypothetical protein
MTAAVDRSPRIYKHDVDETEPFRTPMMKRFSMGLLISIESTGLVSMLCTAPYMNWYF